MATFGYTTDDITTELDGVTPKPGVQLYAWENETGGTPVLDFLSDLDGSFGFAYETTAPGMWVSAGLTGSRWYLPAHEALDSVNDRLDTTETRLGGVEDELPLKLDVAAAISTFAAQWQPNTAYAAGQAVISPTGDTVTAKAAFTSGATYDPTKWVLGTARAAGTFGKVLCLGTSITFGTGASTASANYVSVLPDKMRPNLQGIQPTIINGGKAGDTQGQMYVRLRALLEAERPTYVVIETSINDTRDDLGISPETTEANVRAAVGMTRLFGAVPIVLTSAPIDPAVFGAPYSAASLTKQQQANSLVKTAMDKIGVQVVDMYAVYGGTPQNLSDGVHPNNTGHDQWATIIGNALTGRALPNYQGAYSADTFTRANSASLGTTETGGQTWSAVNAASWTISTNALNCAGGSTAPNDCVVDTTRSDGVLNLTRTTNSTNSGLVFRLSADGSTGYLLYRNGSNYLLARRSGTTTYTTLATSSGITPAAGDVLEVEMNGSSIKARINGALFASVTDATYTGTRHGAWSNLNVASVFDNWKHLPLPTA